MSLAYNKFNTFAADEANGKHNFGSHTYTVALTDTAPVATNAVIADITEISYTNLSSRNLVLTSSSQSSGTYKAIFQDLTITATGSAGPFRYIVIYNSTTSGGPLVCWFDRGSSISMQTGDTYLVDLDNTNGLFSKA